MFITFYKTKEKKGSTKKTYIHSPTPALTLTLSLSLTVTFNHLANEALQVRSNVSLVPRLSCMGGEKRAWYTLFAHAQFSQDFWEFGNFP